MYTDIKTILDDANKNNYAVLAASAFNMELARGLIAAADEMQAPLIILMGQAQMTKHARPELMVPMIKTLAEQTNVPVALILDHGRDWEKITWAYRQGFSSIMVDASAYAFRSYHDHINISRRNYPCTVTPSNSKAMREINPWVLSAST